MSMFACLFHPIQLLTSARCVIFFNFNFQYILLLRYDAFYEKDEYERGENRLKIIIGEKFYIELRNVNMWGKKITIK